MAFVKSEIPLGIPVGKYAFRQFVVKKFIVPRRVRQVDIPETLPLQQAVCQSADPRHKREKERSCRHAPFLLIQTTKPFYSFQPLPLFFRPDICACIRDRHQRCRLSAAAVRTVISHKLALPYIYAVILKHLVQPCGKLFLCHAFFQNRLQKASPSGARYKPPVDQILTG